MADFSTPAFSTPAKSCRCFHSRIFYPCKIVPMFTLPPFPPLHFRPCRFFHSRIFSRPTLHTPMTVSWLSLKYFSHITQSTNSSCLYHLLPPLTDQSICRFQAPDFLKISYVQWLRLKTAWDINATAAARKKVGGGMTGQLTTSMSWKFDAVNRRNRMAPAPGSIHEWLCQGVDVLGLIELIILRTCNSFNSVQTWLFKLCIIWHFYI